MSFDPDGNESVFTSNKPTHNYARFYRQWERNNFKSEQEGREVGEYFDYVLIISPGAPKTEVRRRATEAHKQEFREQWAAYSANKDQMDNGTPLTHLPGMDEGRAAAFKALYCMTIEQLANLSDSGVQTAGMGATEWRAKAQKYLQTHGAALKELEASKARVTDLEATVASLQAQIDALVAATPKRGKKVA